MSKKKFVEVMVQPGFHPMGSGVLKLINKAEAQPRELIMSIATETALYIASVQGMVPPPKRPTTHDLMFLALEKYGIKIVKATVIKLAEKTFYGTLTLQKDNQEEVIDCRPSDGIALAVKTGVSVYVAEDLLHLSSED